MSACEQLRGSTQVCPMLHTTTVMFFNQQKTLNETTEEIAKIDITFLEVRIVIKGGKQMNMNMITTTRRITKTKVKKMKRSMFY